MTIAARHVDITTEDITCANGMPAFLAYPTGGGKFPTVVLMHERYGLVKHTKDQAMRCARDGFAVLAPNFFFKHPDQKALNAGDSRYDLTDPESNELMRAALATLKTHKAADPSKVVGHGLLPDRPPSARVRRRDADHRRRGVVRRGLARANGRSTSCSRRRSRTDRCGQLSGVRRVRRGRPHHLARRRAALPQLPGGEQEELRHPHLSRRAAWLAQRHHAGPLPQDRGRGRLGRAAAFPGGGVRRPMGRRGALAVRERQRRRTTTSPRTCGWSSALGTDELYAAALR